MTTTAIDLGHDGDGEEDEGEDARTSTVVGARRSPGRRSRARPAGRRAPAPSRRAMSAPRTAQRRASGRSRATGRARATVEVVGTASSLPPEEPFRRGRFRSTRLARRPWSQRYAGRHGERHRDARAVEATSRPPTTRSSRRSCSSRRSRSTACAASTEPSRPSQRLARLRVLARLALDPQVALRPEPFGALAYHYGNRRLIFLKHPDVVRVVRALGDHDCVGRRAARVRHRRRPLAVVRRPRSSRCERSQLLR